MADDDEPERWDEPSADPDPAHGPAHAGEHPHRGTMRFQDPDSTTPRPPTLAEQHARQRAERQAAAERADAERRTRTRRRVMIGSGVTVGVAALVASFYYAAAYSEAQGSMIATCTDDQGSQTVVEQDQYCDQNYVTSHGGHVDQASGLYFMPIWLPGGRFGGWHQYRYSYSPSGSSLPGVGQTISRPNFTRPSGTKVSTRSGTTIERGGFGVNSRGGSGS